MMKISDFQKYLDLYGADLSLWPRHEVKAAVDLIQHNPEAGQLLSDAERLDQMLRHYKPASVNLASLAGRIIRETKHARARAKPAPPLNPAYFYVPGGGLLVVAILGFMIGFNASTKDHSLLDALYSTQDQVINDSEEAS